MQKLLCLSLLTGLLAMTAAPAARAQASTNTITVGQFLETSYDTVIGAGLTNLSVSFVETYTPSIKAWGSSLVVARNLPLGDSKISAGIGVAADYYQRNFYGLNCQISLQANLTPFSGWGGFWSNVVVTPFGFNGAGPTIGGGSQGAGAFEEVIAGGLALHIAHVPYINADFALLGLSGTRLGLGNAGGQFYGGGGNFTWKF